MRDRRRASRPLRWLRAGGETSLLADREEKANEASAIMELRHSTTLPNVSKTHAFTVGQFGFHYLSASRRLLCARSMQSGK